MPDNSVLIDSDVFIGLVFREDAHHERVKDLWRKLRQQEVQFITTNLVIAETATMLSRRIDLPTAQHFLELASGIKTLMIGERVHQMTVELFQQQQHRAHTSFVDLANVVVAHQLGMTAIFSFDAVYPKDFGLMLAN